MTERQGDKVSGGGRWRYLIWRGVKWGAWGLMVLVLVVGVWSMLETREWQVYWVGKPDEVGSTGRVMRVGVVSSELGRVGLSYGSDFRSGGGFPTDGGVLGWWDFRDVRAKVRRDELKALQAEQTGGWWWTWAMTETGQIEEGSGSRYGRVSLAGMKVNWRVSRVVLSPGWFRLRSEPLREYVLWRAGVSVPTVYLAVVGAGVAWFAGRRERRARGWWWVREGRCGGCGYDLRGAEGGVAGRCSECGRRWGEEGAGEKSL